jgi:hypothetical protein
VTPGTFPCPNGVSTTFSNVASGTTTPNFTLLDPGLYLITWEPLDPSNPPTVILQQVQGSLTTTLYTWTSPGAAQDLTVPPGGMVLNWNVTGGVARRLSVTLINSSLSIA